MIRDALFGDIMGCVDLLKALHEKSIYAELCGVDEDELKGLLRHSIHHHGGTNRAGTWAQVAENDGELVGLIVGMLSPVYLIGDRLMATDAFYVTGPTCNPRDAIRLLDGFIAWAKDCPKVVEIRCGVTDALGDWKRVGKLYERKGFEPAGAMFAMRMKK